MAKAAKRLGGLGLVDAAASEAGAISEMLTYQALELVQLTGMTEYVMLAYVLLGGQLLLSGTRFSKV